MRLLQPLSEASPSTFRSVRFVLTDMDETLTYRGAWRREPMTRSSDCRRPACR
jgi:hypothetical protein